MPRFRQWEREPWNWERFRRLPFDFQIFAAIGVLAAASAMLLIAALPILHGAS